MHVEVIEESNLLNWDEYLERIPSSVFLSARWLESFRNQNRTPIYFRFVSRGKVLGMIAGLRLEPHSYLGKKLYRPLFFFAGPAVVRADKDLTSLCMTKLTKFAAGHGYSRLFFLSYDYPYIFRFEELVFKKERREYIIDLRGDFSDVIKRMRKSIVRHVKKATRNSLSFYESHSADSISSLKSLLNDTKEFRLNKGYEDYSPFYMPYFGEREMYGVFQNKAARLFFVKKGDKILSGELTIIHSNRAYFLLGGTSQEGYKIGANPFLKFNLIQKLKEEGIEYYNLGGVMGDSTASSLAFYKCSFGAEEKNTPYS